MLMAVLMAAHMAAQVSVIAHRGEHLQNPENSLNAIEGAIAAGADYVELDVRTTRDGHLILMHDDTVDRTTSGHGKVSQLSLAEIEHLELKPAADTGSASAKVPSFEHALHTEEHTS